MDQTYNTFWIRSWDDRCYICKKTIPVKTNATTKKGIWVIAEDSKKFFCAQHFKELPMSEDDLLTFHHQAEMISLYLDVQ